MVTARTFMPLVVAAFAVFSPAGAAIAQTDNDTIDLLKWGTELIVTREIKFPADSFDHAFWDEPDETAVCTIYLTKRTDEGFSLLPGDVIILSGEGTLLGLEEAPYISAVAYVAYPAYIQSIQCTHRKGGRASVGLLKSLTKDYLELKWHWVKL